MSSQFIDKILDSLFFKSSLSAATKAKSNAQSLLLILKNALQKTQELGTGGVFDLIREKIVLLGDLIRAFAAGEYRDISSKNIITITAGLLYFILPLDLIPDLLPLIGYADDIALLSFIVNSVGEELEKFKLWQLNKDLNKD